MNNNTKTFGNLYLDTDILKSLNFRIHEDTRWSNLKGVLNLLKINTFIPQIVLDELIVLRKEELKMLFNDFKKFAKSIKRINGYIDSQAELNLKDESILEKEMINNLRQNIGKADIKIFGIPYEKISLEKIVVMAIEKKKPFGNNEDKGFKDVVILYSILGHNRKCLNSESFFLTANTNDFNNDNVENIIKKEEANLKVVFSMEELNRYLNEFLAIELRSHIIRKENELTEFLLSNKQEILAFIRKEGNFSKNYFQEKLPLFSLINGIRDIEFLDIVNPYVGSLVQSDKGSVEIIFKVELKFYVFVRQMPTYEEPPLKITGAAPQYLTGSVKLYSTLEESIIEGEVTIKGQVYVEKVDEKEKYSNLRLDEVLEVGSFSLAKALSEASTIVSVGDWGQAFDK